MYEAADANELDDFMWLDHEFDDVLCEAAQNPFATEAVAPLHVHCRRFWYRFRANGDLAESARLHEELMRAVADGEEQRAAQSSDALINYLVRFTRSVLNLG